MNCKRRLLVAVGAAMLALGGASGASETVGFSVVTTRAGGERVSVRRTVPVAGGRATFVWPRADIPSDATSVEVIPDFATATKGEEGYFVMPQGGGWNLPERADWDLKCGTSEEFDECVKTIKAGTDEYNRRAELEWEFMDDHREVIPGVFRTTYSNGARTYVNYGQASVTVEGVEVPSLGSAVVPPKGNEK